ncbi:DEAD/DEAH box helicase [Methylocystis sp. L43]|uniref:DEAD/DEAH box helicase n=1 Tax=unclassified Methylocystis TaxID=2625913 RepID=UPI0018C2FE3F|nr:MULTISPECIES: DEAD/DEAH box helicase [unclassified Methylocystis]MBG0797172.1 DEAD/DEAH box helicase [Methylocystis sp. L43]MBG0804957.1 DEAD/DEAH box helicase [Methylocystis sp. H15]
MTLLDGPTGNLRPMRPHQARALETLRASLRAGHRRPLLQAPTGFGKTLTAAHIIARALEKDHRIIFTVPALSLVEQTVDAFRNEGIDCVGVIQGDHGLTDLSQPVQICSVQTLARREKPEAALVIIDEAHRMFAAVNEWMSDPAWADVPFIGLSATPWSRGLGRYYDDLVVAACTGDLIDAGYLSPFVVYAPSEPDLTGVRTVAGEFHQGQLADACNDGKLVGDVVSTWLARGENRPTLAYGVDRAHAEHLQQRFLEAGIAAEYIDAFTDNAERERIFRRFRAGVTKIITNCATLTTGVDLDVRCVVDAKPTKSEILFVQTIGRGLRTASGKDKLIILDHAGNHLRLGMVTDIHHEHLDDGTPKKSGADDREKSVPLPRLCEACSAVMPRTAVVCEQCGTVREVKCEVDAIDGELVELGSGTRPEKRESTANEKREFLGELRFIAAERGYSDGWSSHKFLEKFGHWPNDAWTRSAGPTAPSLKTRNWIRSRQIAFAKAKRKAAHG